MQKLFVYVSGVARGDPGPAAVGVLLTDDLGHVVERVSRLIGRTTQRVAEFKAVIEGAQKAASYAPEEAVIITDSAAVANFISGISQPREPHLSHLRELTLKVLEELPKWRVNYLSREANGTAWRLAERAFREHTRSQRERERLLREIQGLVAELPLEDLRKLQTQLRKLRSGSSYQVPGAG